MTHWLALDLSSPQGTLSLHHTTGELLLEHPLGQSFQHTERLLPALSELLSEAKLSFSNLSRFITVSGPGSFTGLRVALSCLKAFAMVTNCPVDTLSGSEARALTWAKTAKLKIGDNLWVLTHVSAGRFVAAHFTYEEGGGLKFKSEQVETALSNSQQGNHFYLTDDRIPQELLPKGAISFPLQASYLASCLLTASSRKTYTTLAEWIALSPEYFGAQHYG